MRFADYVYRNAADTVRVRVFKKDNGGWDFDVVRRVGEPSFGVLASHGDQASLRREAVERATDIVGNPLTPAKVRALNEGWS